MAELRRHSDGLEVATSDGESFGRSLGFGTCKRTRGRRRKSGPRAYPRQRFTIYRHPGAAALILYVQEAAANRALPSTPPSCLPARG
jgi:hypothetical protein